MKKGIVKTVCTKDCFGGCPLEVHLEDGEVREIKGNPESLVNKGIICAKGKRYPIEILRHKERLASPLKRDGDGFKPISWEEALRILHSSLKEIREKHGAEAVAYYQGSGNFGVMNKYALGFWYQFGNYTEMYGSLCNPAGNLAVSYTYGANKQNHLSDLLNSDLILLWGSNPANTYVQCMSHIDKAVAGGARLITIDPVKSESAKRSALHLYPHGGADGLLALGIAKRLIEEGLTDEEFIERHTTGFDEFRRSLEWLDMEAVFDKTKITKGELDALVGHMKSASRMALICGTGLQRYSNGGQTVRAIAVIPAMLGQIGRQGCGFYYNDKQAPELKWPFLPKKPEGVRKISKATLARDLTMLDNPKIKAFWIEKANPMVSNPNVSRMAESLSAMDFVVVIDQFLTDTAKLAHLVLPATSLLEQSDIATTYGQSYVQLKQRAVRPLAGCKDEHWIYRRLGEMFGFDLKYLPEDEREIFDAVIKSSGLNTDLESLRENPYLHDGYQSIAYADYKFNTPSGKIEFYSEKISEDWGLTPLPSHADMIEGAFRKSEGGSKYPLHFFTRHAKERINSQFGEIGSLREIDPTPKVQIHVNDAEIRGIKNGDDVRIFNDRGAITASAETTPFICEGGACMTFGWNQSDGASVNMLTECRENDLGNGCAFHDCAVEICPVADIKNQES